MNWLGAEGFLGLVWGGGPWFAKGVSMAGLRGSPRASRLGKRREISAQKGRAYIQRPSRIRWHDMLMINGTRYLDSGSVEMLYQSVDGKVLNMTG